ncbi:MAG: cell division ATP-binding protein FtsE [Pseudolysinimonas sp.]|uniref:cell division ATP-binding protein FtsE n=1 Tax=Pseudolysinimonas sp. TaxID=2680009 RepID=UPI003264C649
MIRFDGVTKTYPGTSRPALNSVNLEVLKGEFVFLVGASGSGKSSFLRLVLKEDQPTKGAIHVLGQDLGSLSSGKVPYFRRSLGVVFQDFRLLPNKTVFDNVAFSLQVIGKSKGFIQEAVPDVLKMVGLGGKQGRYPHELSGGEQQRVAIARAIVNKPAILLADEPTGNLDPATSAGIMTLLASINAGGTTVLMATHDAGIVDQMKRRVIELISGQIVRDERQGGYTTTIPVQTQRANNPDSNMVDAAAAVPTPSPTPTPNPAPATAPIPVTQEAAVTAPTEAETDAETDVTDVDEAAPASIPIVARNEKEPVSTSPGPVIPEPGSGPPPGFQWPRAPGS